MFSPEVRQFVPVLRQVCLTGWASGRKAISRLANPKLSFSDVINPQPQNREDADNLYLGIDVGGTNIKAGIVSEAGEVLANGSVPTQADRGPDHGIEQMAVAAQEVLQQTGHTLNDITAVGLATPGTMDIPAGMLLNPANLRWTNYPVRQNLENILQRPTVLQNDANAAAYGEYWAGSASHANSLVFYTLGTGLGGGIIVDDTIVQGDHSHGSEIGHMVLEMHNGRYCNTGQYGTAEAYCSATALLQQYERAIADNRPTSVTARISEGTPVTPLMIAEEAEKGDELATELILEMARCLGTAVTSVCHVIDPGIVLLGGAMTFGRMETEIGKRFIETVRSEFQKRAFPVLAEKITIDYASLGGSAGFIGAAGCARRAVRHGLLKT